MKDKVMKNKSGLWNAGFGEIGATLKALENAGVTLEQFSKLRSDKELVKKIADLLKKANNDESFSLVVDHNKTVEQAIAEGNYDWVNTSITDRNFSTNEIGICTESTKLFHFKRNISSDNAITEMDKAGYRPATLMELLTLGILFPDLQRQFPIVALGSVLRVTDGNHSVPYLGLTTSKRGLHLHWFNCMWDARDRFLGVRK